ncbi:arginase-1 [Condylostylus longicornis]|uniref:arginase-1 n=1 Tax=Condylostylus longicornis TaxID=2530218 RepID=UPI00244DBAF6|nr:arginase-1 [Condylostylus longicornis]XP_055374916.1 arginase-1 [Condylostylus longicornis]
MLPGIVQKINLISKNLKYQKIFYKQIACYSISKTQNLGIIGVPFYKGQPKSGVDLAPKFLRDYGLIEKLKNIGNKKIIDYGDLTYNLENVKTLENALNYQDVISVNKALSLKIQEILKENDQFLVLGGDHSIGFGSIAGHLAFDPNISVIWIDAHADLNTYLSSNSGNIHGMPLSMVIDELKDYYIKTDVSKIVKNYLPAKNLYYIGLRDLDSFEKSFIREKGIMAFGMMDIEKLGIPTIMDFIIKSIGSNNKIHISFDVDSLDPSISPSTGTSVFGGLNLREIFYILEKLNDTGNVTGFDVVEINPLLGDERDANLTVNTAIEAIKIIMGYKRF